MRVLVTGGAGLIGREAVAQLASEGHEVTALSLGGPFPPEADRVVEGDATSPEVVADALAEAEAVVHLAAIPHPRLGPAWKVFGANVGATFTVLETAAERGVRRAVIASSINASGIPFNPQVHTPPWFPIDEDLPPDVADPYSLSKLTDEHTARTMGRRWGMDVVALRFPLVRDAAGLRAAAERRRSDPGGGVKEGWSYLDVRDAGRALLAALGTEVRGVHVVGLSAADTLLDEPTMDLIGRWAPGVPVRAPIPGRSAAVSGERARQLLGFEPRWSVHDAPG